MLTLKSRARYIRIRIQESHATCLTLNASHTGFCCAVDDIMPFLKDNIENRDWNYKTTIFHSWHGEGKRRRKEIFGQKVHSS
jgi:hypothetical protein